MLEMCGMLLSRYQGIMPGNGIIWRGREGKATKICLNSDPRNVEQLLMGLQETLNSETPPKLILNEHCRVCECRARCHDQAMQEDNLSLLRGMSEKEIKNLGKKGIFTITQLAHTFRPRRKGKREAQTTNRRQYALQAMAIRDKKIYVLGKPELPSGAAHVYLDIEGDPEADFIYLIGMVIVENGLEKSHSFWADQKDQEAKILYPFGNRSLTQPFTPHRTYRPLSDHSVSAIARDCRACSRYSLHRYSIYFLGGIRWWILFRLNCSNYKLVLKPGAPTANTSGKRSLMNSEARRCKCSGLTRLRLFIGS